MRASRGSLRDGRASVFGYHGRAGDEASAIFDEAKAKLHLDPVQAPIENEAGETAFAFGAADGQPVQSAYTADGSFLIISGRVYESRGPAEILNAWLAQGVAAFENLDFQGFVAAWNASVSEFQLIRDRYGLETGFYARLAGGVLFANDQQTLLKFGVDPARHPEAIDTFLAADYFPAPLTPYMAISKVPPGNHVSFRGGEGTTEYWTRYLPVDDVSYEVGVTQIGPVLKGALERMWPDDGDVGLLLSGGIDSAMVAVGITQLLDRPVRAFTFRYEEYEGRLNESEAARVVARHLDIPHEDIPVRPTDLINDLDDAVAAYGEPFNWGMHSYRVGPIADRGIRTVFSGAGADGTGVAKRHRVAHRFYTLPAIVKGAVRTAVRAARPIGLGMQQKAEWVTRNAEDFGVLFSPDSELSRSQRALLYGDPALACSGSRLLASIYRDAAARLPADDPRALAIMDKRFTSAEALASWNRAFPREHGMDTLLPFYDPRYIALGLGVRGADGKELIRRLSEDYLPPEATNAPKNAQEMPVSHWIKYPLADLVRERLFDLPPEMTEIFDPAGVRSAVDRHIAGSVDNGWQIISLLTLESWFRQQAS